MKPKVLLVNPPFWRLLGSHFNSLPLGLCYIASVLKANNHNVLVYNTDYDSKPDYSNIKEIYNNYEDYKEILSNLNHLIWQEINKQIIKYSPDIVGITINTSTYKSAENIAKLIKTHNKNVQIIVGGIHPTVLPNETIQSSYFDLVVRGEGEFTFLEILNGKSSYDKIKGITYYEGETNQIFENPQRDFVCNLDCLPFPARDLFLNDTKYMEYGYILSGRGCPFNCTFCASEKLWKSQVRFRSPENVINEIDHVYDTYGTRFFYFVDDTFTLNKERIKRICTDLKVFDDITWICNVRVGTVSEQTLQIMKDSGCIRLKVGIESGSDRILRKHKSITKKQVKDFISLTKKVGIDITGYFMIGFPEETNETVKETIFFAKELDLSYISPSILTPYPGTKIYDDMIKSGVNLPSKWEYFFHQSKDMVRNINEEFVDEFISLGERGERI